MSHHQDRPAEQVPGVDALRQLDCRELTSALAAALGAYGELRVSYEDAVETLGRVLTEQIARQALLEYPHAATLPVSMTHRGHADSMKSGQTIETVGAGTLRPGCLSSADGELLGRLGPLSPALFWLELLSPLFDDGGAVLRLASREWVDADVLRRRGP